MQDKLYGFERNQVWELIGHIIVKGVTQDECSKTNWIKEGIVIRNKISLVA